MVRITYISLIILIIILTSVINAIAIDRIDIRGQTLEVIDEKQYILESKVFPAFFYDMDKNIGSERLRLKIIEDNILLKKKGILYETIAEPEEMEFNKWGNFYSIGFLGEKYFAGYGDSSILLNGSNYINSLNHEKLAKVLINSNPDKELQLRSSLKSHLRLEEGYDLVFKDINDKGDKIYVLLMKNGKQVGSASISPGDKDILASTFMQKVPIRTNENEFTIIAIHFKNSFYGVSDSYTTVDGIFQISDSFIDIIEGSKVNNMTISSVDQYNRKINMENRNNITLRPGQDITLMGNLRIKTAEQDISPAKPLRFYIYKRVSDPGTHEIRGSVEPIMNGNVNWDADSFAGFYRDIDNNIKTEDITMTITDNKQLEKKTGIEYTTQTQKAKFDFENWGHFEVIGFLGEKYFAAYDDGYLHDISDDQNLIAHELLSRVLIDSDNHIILKSNESYKLKDNYKLIIRSIDGPGNKVYVELSKEGTVIDSNVVSPSKNNATILDKTYCYKKDLGAVENIVTIAVHFDNAFSNDTKIASIDGIWQISDTVSSIKEGSTYGELAITNMDSEKGFITMNNKDKSISLITKDLPLTDFIRIKTSDRLIQDGGLRQFYIYKSVPIDELSINTILISGNND